MVGRFFQLIIWFDRDFSSAPSGLAKSSPLIQGRRAARLPLATVFRAFGAHLTFEAKLSVPEFVKTQGACQTSELVKPPRLFP